MDVINQIKEYMKEDGVLQKDLSHATGISIEHVSDYMNGLRGNPTLKTLTKMCDALGLEIVVKRKDIVEEG